MSGESIDIINVDGLLLGDTFSSTGRKTPISHVFSQFQITENFSCEVLLQRVGYYLLLSRTKQVRIDLEIDELWGAMQWCALRQMRGRISKKERSATFIGSRRPIWLKLKTEASGYYHVCARCCCTNDSLPVISGGEMEPMSSSTACPRAGFGDGVVLKNELPPVDAILEDGVLVAPRRLMFDASATDDRLSWRFFESRTALIQKLFFVSSNPDLKYLGGHLFTSLKKFEPFNDSRLRYFLRRGTGYCMPDHVNVMKLHEVFEIIGFYQHVDMSNVMYVGFAPGNDFGPALEMGIRNFCSLTKNNELHSYVRPMAHAVGANIILDDYKNVHWKGIVYSDANVMRDKPGVVSLQEYIQVTSSAYIVKCNARDGDVNPYEMASEMLRYDPRAMVFKVMSSRKSNEEVFVTNMLPWRRSRGWAPILQNRVEYIRKVEMLLRCDFPIINQYAAEDGLIPASWNLDLKQVNAGCDSSHALIDQLYLHSMKLARLRWRVNGCGKGELDTGMIDAAGALMNAISEIASGTIYVIGSSRSEKLRLAGFKNLVHVNAISEGGANLADFESYLGRTEKGDWLWFYNMHGLSPLFFNSLQARCLEKGVGLCVRMNTTGDRVQLRTKGRKRTDLPPCLNDFGLLTGGVKGRYLSILHDWEKVFKSWDNGDLWYDRGGIIGISKPERADRELTAEDMWEGGAPITYPTVDGYAVYKYVWDRFGTTTANMSKITQQYVKTLNFAGKKVGGLIISTPMEGVQRDAVYIPNSGNLFIARYNPTVSVIFPLLGDALRSIDEKQ
jgi:hypothetical protein